MPSKAVLGSETCKKGTLWVLRSGRQAAGVDGDLPVRAGEEPARIGSGGVARPRHSSTGNESKGSEPRVAGGSGREDA